MKRTIVAALALVFAMGLQARICTCPIGDH